MLIISSVSHTITKQTLIKKTQLIPPSPFLGPGLGQGQTTPPDTFLWVFECPGFSLQSVTRPWTQAVPNHVVDSGQGFLFSVPEISSVTWISHQNRESRSQFPLNNPGLWSCWERLLPFCASACLILTVIL